MEPARCPLSARFRRSSTPPQFTLGAGGRRPRRYVAAGALALTVAALRLWYGAGATYMRTPADRAVTAKAPAVSAPNAGTTTGAADHAGRRPRLARTLSPGRRPAGLCAAARELDARPVAKLVAGKYVRTQPSGAEDRRAGPGSCGRRISDGRRAQRGRRRCRGRDEVRTTLPGQGAGREVVARRAPPQAHKSAAAQGTAAWRSRRSREVREADLPWRFAPTLRADIDTLRRREDGRPPQPSPRYYGWSGYEARRRCNREKCLAVADRPHLSACSSCL